MHSGLRCLRTDLRSSKNQLIRMPDMDSNPQNTPPGMASTGSVPRAVWIGGGLLCLITAGLAGALITRSVDSTHGAADTPSPQAAQATAAAAAGCQ